MTYPDELREAMIELFKTQGLEAHEAHILVGLKQIDHFDELSTKERKQMAELEKKIR